MLHIRESRTNNSSEEVNISNLRIDYELKMLGLKLFVFKICIKFI